MDVDEERETLFDHLVEAVQVGLRHGLRNPPDEEAIGAVAAMAVTGVLRRVRVMSGRQLAVLISAPPNRHEGWSIKEPPDYWDGR